MRIVLNHLGRDRTVAREVPSGSRSAHGRRMIQQSSTRRRESQLSLACVQLCHEFGVASDVAFEGGWVSAASGLMLREFELVVHCASNINEHVRVSVSESEFKRGAEFTAFGIGFIGSLK
eukprot:6181338-Pleurochrysis_carterae.AAC.1